LIIPAVAGASLGVACFAGGRWVRGIAIAGLILIACIGFGKARRPKMDRADQSSKHMTAAIEFVSTKIDPAALIFTDYQSDLILSRYLCPPRPIEFDPAPVFFEQFSCGNHRVVSRDYRAWVFGADDFPEEWQRLIQAYGLKPGISVWIFQAGWGADLPEDLRRQQQFRDLPFESFGKNIKIFKMTVGPAVSSARN
jgi:hypothetical protein